MCQINISVCCRVTSVCSAEFYRSRSYCHCMVKLEGSGSEEWSCEYCEFNMVQNRNMVLILGGLSFNRKMCH